MQAAPLLDESYLGAFGDPRRAATGALILDAAKRQLTSTVPALADDRNQARRFLTFLDSEHVTIQEMLAHCGRLTAAEAKDRHILAICDTTELNFAGHAGSKRGFGTAGNGTDLGVFLHPTIAVDADRGGLLGLVGAEVMNRIAGPAGDHKQRPAEAKESRRWLDSTCTAADVLAGAAMITVVQDREGDIYDQFARRPEGVELLVRAAQDRVVGPQQKLFAAVAASPERDRCLIKVPAKPGQAERIARVALRWSEVTIHRPHHADASLPATVTLRVVDVSEIDPPTPHSAVRWCLLTTHPVTSVAQARRIVGWYRMRWIIEQVFRTLKTDGMDIESSQLTLANTLLKLAMITLIAAVRVMQLVLARDGSTEQSITAVADDADMPALREINATLEGRTEKLKNPHPENSLAYYAWIAARLGGWSGYTSRGYRPPGPKTIARGLKRLDAMLAGWRLANNRSGLHGLR
jgi:hypothetical protein